MLILLLLPQPMPLGCPTEIILPNRTAVTGIKLIKIDALACRHRFAPPVKDHVSYLALSFLTRIIFTQTLYNIFILILTD